MHYFELNLCCSSIDRSLSLIYVRSTVTYKVRMKQIQLYMYDVYLCTYASRQLWIHFCDEEENYLIFLTIGVVMKDIRLTSKTMKSTLFAIGYAVSENHRDEFNTTSRKSCISIEPTRVFSPKSLLNVNTSIKLFHVVC